MSLLKITHTQMLILKVTYNQMFMKFCLNGSSETLESLESELSPVAVNTDYLLWS